MLSVKFDLLVVLHPVETMDVYIKFMAIHPKVVVIFVQKTNISSHRETGICKLCCAQMLARSTCRMRSNHTSHKPLQGIKWLQSITSEPAANRQAKSFLVKEPTEAIQTCLVKKTNFFSHTAIQFDVNNSGHPIFWYINCSWCSMSHVFTLDHIFIGSVHTTVSTV